MRETLKQTTVFNKLLCAKHFTEKPHIIVSDFDGSLFTPDVRVLYESLHQNKKLMHTLNRKFIPLIINTGRTDWLRKDKIDARLVGIHADAVITGAGTKIYHRNLEGKLFLDIHWKKFLAKQLLTIHGKTYQWGYQATVQEIQKTIETYLDKETNALPLIAKKGNLFLVRYRIKGVSNNQLLDLRDQLEKLFAKGVKAIFTEHLFSRSFGIPTGDILLIPTAAGKDAATKYILDTYAALSKTKLVAYCFGDGTIDLSSFLTMPSEEKFYSLQQFLVHPTSLAKEVCTRLSEKQKPTILLQTGPTAILQTIVLKTSLAQNSKLRKFLLQPTSNILDLIYPKNLSANEISLLGLQHVIDGIDTLYSKQVKQKSKALRIYLLGLFADIADGIRARKTIPASKGQLVDVFSDRAREFYQLYKRGLQRLEINSNEGLITLEAAVSCILPSLARAKAEAQGTIVQENAKGAAFWRTKKLFASLMNDIFLGNKQKSFIIDKEILATSLENYHIRMQHVESKGMKKIKQVDSLQQKAEERYILLVTIFQEGVKLVQKKLSPLLKKQFEEWLINNHLIHVENSSFQVIDEFLSLKKYIK